VKVDVSKFTQNKPGKILKAFNKIIAKVQQWDEVMVSPAKTAVYLKAPSNFLSIKITKNRVDLEFYLPQHTDEFPIYKILQITKTRILHCVALEDEKEVNAQLMNWIKQSYEIMREKKTGTRKTRNPRKSAGKQVIPPSAK
jgi:hypothetical protein